MSNVKYLIRKISLTLSFLSMPFVLASALILKYVRLLKLERYRPTKNIFCSVGIFPISDHFYEPLFNPAHLRKSLREDRHLPGIDFNVDEQLRLLGSFDYNREIETIPLENPSGLRFYMTTATLNRVTQSIITIWFGSSNHRK
jgi:hypothetical protein